MAIVTARTLKVVGGITYRLFDQRGFAEIVFCAISSVEQVKVGYPNKDYELICVGVWLAFDEPLKGPHPQRH